MQTLLIIGGGFAALDAALSAARRRALAGAGPETLRIAMIAPQPHLVIRPRLYEPRPEMMAAPYDDVLAEVEVEFWPGTVTAIDTGARRVTYAPGEGEGEREAAYDSLVVATGSQLFRPPVPGLAEHGFSIDQLADAVALDKHVKALAQRPRSAARDTVVVVGGGFTGIEAASEMPGRLRDALGEDAAVRVVIVERSQTVAPDLGPNPQPIVRQALAEAGIETIPGASVTAIHPDGVVLDSGETIATATVVWSAGMRAAPIVAQVPGEHDATGRLVVDACLRAPSAPGVYATGDAARAACDEDGHVALMSCQHAKRMGAFAGNNAAAELLGHEAEPYHQRAYVTCLDLGPDGAVFTRGWDRNVELTGAEAKAVKAEINTVWIYPPKPDRDAIFAYAEPARVVEL